PVLLLTKDDPLVEYDFASQPFQDLKQHYTPAAKASPKTDLFDAAGFAGKKMSPVFKNLNPQDRLAADCKLKLDPEPIFQQCGFLREALLKGGATYNEPLWKASLQCAVHMEGGDGIAHKISQGHPAYSPDATSAKYDEQVA